jgi:hypothetical protein
MPGPELSRSILDALTRSAEVAYQIGRRLQFALKDPDSFMVRLAHALKRLETGPPVPGFEALLISAGCRPFEARFMAIAIHHCGKKMAQEERAKRSLASTLGKLARTAGKSTLVISRRAKALRDLLDDEYAGAALNRACQKAKRPELATELLHLMSRAIDRDPAACEMLTARAASLLSYLPKPSGRPVSAATAKHELLLDELHYRGKPRRFTRDSISDTFVDPATKATRIATGEQSFDPKTRLRPLQAALGPGLHSLRAYCKKLMEDPWRGAAPNATAGA